MATTHLVSPQPKPHPVLLKNLFPKNRAVAQINPQFVQRPHIRLQIKGSANQRTEAVVGRAQMPASFGQFLRRHIFGPESGVVEAVFRVQPPFAVVEQAAFGLEFLIQRRAGIGHEDIEGG